ncbi:hypothetical protein VNO77_14943 [Canavalia gladiata]|uniref:Uncharacterized protein n=1 Tax=Canavalia gladiata TaxID=3824 RepID=A0AAN9QR62_CANGL
MLATNIDVGMVTKVNVERVWKSYKPMKWMWQLFGIISYLWYYKKCLDNPTLKQQIMAVKDRSQLIVKPKCSTPMQARTDSGSINPTPGFCPSLHLTAHAMAKICLGDVCKPHFRYIPELKCLMKSMHPHLEITASCDYQATEEGHERSVHTPHIDEPYCYQRSPTLYVLTAQWLGGSCHSRLLEFLSLFLLLVVGIYMAPQLVLLLILFGSTIGGVATFILGRIIGKSFIVSRLKDYPQFRSVAITIERSNFKGWGEFSKTHFPWIIVGLVISVALMIRVTKVARFALDKAMAECENMDGIASSPQLPMSLLRNYAPKEDFGGGHLDHNMTYAEELVSRMGLGKSELQREPRICYYNHSHNHCNSGIACRWPKSQVWQNLNGQYRTKIKELVFSFKVQLHQMEG